MAKHRFSKCFNLWSVKLKAQVSLCVIRRRKVEWKFDLLFLNCDIIWEWEVTFTFGTLCPRGTLSLYTLNYIYSLSLSLSIYIYIYMCILYIYTPSTTNFEEEGIVYAPGNDGNASMPEQVKRPNPWRKMMKIIYIYITSNRNEYQEHFLELKMAGA